MVVARERVSPPSGRWPPGRGSVNRVPPEPTAPADRRMTDACIRILWGVAKPAVINDGRQCGRYPWILCHDKRSGSVSV